MPIAESSGSRVSSLWNKKTQDRKCKAIMKVDVLPVVGKIHASKLMDVTVIVVDVLRATTCMIVGIENGAAKIIPTADAAEAASFVARLGVRDCLLAGESGGLKTPGFDIGNSPSEFSEERVKNRTIVMNTTNGSSAVCAVSAADDIYIGAMINASAVAKRAFDNGRDVLIACAGTDGKISADDVLTAGAIAEELVRLSGGTAELTDTAHISCWLYKGYVDGRVPIEESLHYTRLVKLGFADDIALCFKRDTTQIVPAYKYGIIQ